DGGDGHGGKKDGKTEGRKDGREEAVLPSFRLLLDSIPMPHAALRTLLAGSIDYAGLFPPAGLDMATSVRQYADYRSHPDAWALGRFVVPAARLAELEREAAPLAPTAPADPWRLSALLGSDVAGDLHALGE